MKNRVTLIGKPGCHLCDNARLVISSVCTELKVGWIELSILDDPKLGDLYYELIPVTLVDDKVHDQLRVDSIRLRKALS